MKNSYTVNIDCEVKNKFELCTMIPPIHMHNPTYALIFTASVYMNGSKALKKSFKAEYKERECENEEYICKKIIEQFKLTKDVDIYDCPYWEVPGPDDIVVFLFSKKAKQIFEFLSRHTQKLLESIL